MDGEGASLEGQDTEARPVAAVLVGFGLRSRKAGYGCGLPGPGNSPSSGERIAWTAAGASTYLGTAQPT